jgi:hypothetical protein
MLQDVGTVTGITSILVLGICAWVAIVDVRRWQQRLPVRAGLKRLFLWAGAAVFVFWIAQALSNTSGVPHASTTGPVISVQKALYHGDREGMIACVQDCKSVLLNFDPEATKAVREYPPGTPFKIGFLDERKEVYPNVFGFEVVDVWDASGNAEYYHFDTSYHPVRLILLGMDALILILCGVLCTRLAEAELDPEDAALAAAETEPALAAAPPAYRRRERPVFNFASARDGAEPAD